MKITDNEVLFLNDKQVKDMLSLEKVLELVEQSFIEYSEGEAVNPVKLHLPAYPKYEGYLDAMPAFLKRLDILGAKTVSVYRNNKKDYGLPATIGTIVLNDAKTGRPYSIMNGTYVTSVRTGAVMGVMAKYCSKKNPKVLTVIGAGAQGYSAFTMICLALPEIEEVRVVDIMEENQDVFIAEGSNLYPNKKYIKLTDIQEACSGSDLILSAAGGDKPLLANIEFSKGATVLDLAETYGGTFVRKFDKYIGDFGDCLVERINEDAVHHCEITGDPYDGLEKNDVSAEIGDIITGKAKGRENNEEIILASSVGMGIQDLIVAEEVYKNAIKNDVGTVLDF